MRTTTKLELRPIAELKPYEENARIHSPQQIEKLRASLREFGFVSPVLIDSGGSVIAGHGRIEAAKLENITEAPCVLVEHLSEAQCRAYVLADNRLAELASWDMETVESELLFLHESGFDIELTGFETELLIAAEPVVEDDCDLEPPVEPIAKAGNIWQLGRHRLMCGDSCDADSVKTLMSGALADMVFTDPPWNVDYGNVKRGNAQGYKPRKILNDSMSASDFASFLESAFNCMALVQKPGAMTYVVMAGQEWGYLMQVLSAAGYHWSSTIIWNKDQFAITRKDYHPKYEPIWYGWKEGSRLCPLKDRTQCDVWDIPRPKKNDDHPTMKPIELVARAVQNSSKPEDIVLDLFGGSGSTLMACEQTGRSCYMMELDPKYCDVIIRRWEAYTGGKAELIK